MEKRKSGLRRPWRFRLSTLLIAVTVIGVWLAVMFGRVPLSIENLPQLQERTRIELDVWKVVWRNDGRRLAVLGWEKPVQVHDGITLWKMQTIGEGKKIVHFAFGPDDNTVAYCENGMPPCLLDLAKGETRVLKAPPGQWKLSFSPDGRYLATGTYGKAALVWDVVSGDLVRELDMGRTEGALTPLYSPDGRYLAVGHRNSSTKLFRADSGEQLLVLPKRMSHELAFHPTLPVIAVAYVDGSIALWDTNDGSLLQQVQTTAKEIYTLDWSNDGRILASAGLNGQIDLWSGSDLAKLHSIEGPDWVISVRFRPDMQGIVVTGGEQRPGGRRFLQELAVPSLTQKLARGQW